MRRRKKWMSVGAVLLLLLILCLGTVGEKSTYDAREVIIAVLDTGYSGDNSRVLNGINIIEESNDIKDGNSHGTRIIEMILGATGENVKIIPIKVADYTGYATEESASRGIRTAMVHNVDIIHLALNKSDVKPDSELLDALDEAVEAGIEIVVSAGNAGKNVASVFPANLEEAIVVSAIDENNEICSYSNFGSTVDFATYGYYKGESGTSYSAARVTAMLAEELGKGGSLETLQKKAIDAGDLGPDEYYGYGILATEDIYEEREEKVFFGKSGNDLGYRILDIDWRKLDTEELDNYFIETNSVYVGMFLSKLGQEEFAELKQKSCILNSDVLIQDFVYEEQSDSYVEQINYEKNFAENAIRKYQEYERELTISAEWIMLKNTGYFAISSNSRNDVFYFQIDGFSYKTVTPDSPWFSMFAPEKLSVTRTTVKQTTDFGEVQVAGFDKYLYYGNSFATEYTDPESGEKIVNDNFYAIDSGADTGALNYGLSIVIEGYSNEQEGYHTTEDDIRLIPYNYKHTYEEYSYNDYKSPLKYTFAYYVESTNSTEYAATPQKVESQKKNFKKLITTEQTLWYNGTYKSGYNYSKVDTSLSLEEKIGKYLKSYSKKTISDVNIYSQESSLHESGFSINADLMSSLGLQWNNGETSTIAVQNDIPEYNFPLVINSYMIVYDGNGATTGGLTCTTVLYDEEKKLDANQYSREGHIFRGWSTKPDGDVEFEDEEVVCNLALEHNATVVLYAVWDEFPWILAEDLYFPLKEAQAGEITYDKLMSYARAEDKEAGGVVTPGVDEEKGTSFIMLDYEAANYTELTEEASIPATYQVIDSAGSTYEKQIMVHLVDTLAKEELPKGYTRFISAKYYAKNFENGGLEENSIWLVNQEYVETIRRAFSNSQMGVPVMRMTFSSEKIKRMKEFIEMSGVGNDINSNALEMFYRQFLAGI